MVRINLNLLSIFLKNTFYFQVITSKSAYFLKYKYIKNNLKIQIYNRPKPLICFTSFLKDDRLYIVYYI